MTAPVGGAEVDLHQAAASSRTRAPSGGASHAIRTPALLIIPITIGRRDDVLAWHKLVRPERKHGALPLIVGDADGKKNRQAQHGARAQGEDEEEVHRSARSVTTVSAPRMILRPQESVIVMFLFYLGTEWTLRVRFKKLGACFRVMASEGLAKGALDRDARIEARRRRIEAHLGATPDDAEGWSPRQ